MVNCNELFNGIRECEVLVGEKNAQHESELISINISSLFDSLIFNGSFTNFMTLLKNKINFNHFKIENLFKYTFIFEPIDSEIKES